MTWKIPPMTTATRNTSNASIPPSSFIALITITAKPAAGPLTPSWEPLKAPTTIPPMIPAMIPENNGAPDAKAIPKHNGTATKNTTTEAGKSFFRLLKMPSFFVGLIFHFFLMKLLEVVVRVQSALSIQSESELEITSMLDNKIPGR